MKTLKRSVAVLLSVLMLLSVFSATAMTASADASTTVYFVNTQDWASVYCYAWMDDANHTSVTGTWPGQAATLIDPENKVYSYDIGEAANVIFNDNNETQTGDLLAADAVGKYYEFKTNTFYNTVNDALAAGNTDNNSTTTNTTTYYVCGVSALCGTEWQLADSNNAMTANEDGSYSKTYTNVAMGTYEFKVNNGTWGESYPANNTLVSVDETQDGATVVITLTADKEVVVDVQAEGQPSTEPSESTPAEDTNTTDPVVENPAVKEVTVDVATATADTVTINFTLQAAEKLINGEGSLTYDSSALQLADFQFLNVTGSIHNTDLYNEVRFNFSDVSNLADFTTATDFIVATFKVLKDSKSTVALNLVELNAYGDKDIPLVTNGVVVGEFTLTEKTTIVAPTEPTTESVAPTTESTAPTTETKDPSTDNTEPTTDAPKLTVKKTKLSAGATTKASVSNTNGKKVTYKSTKTKVAKIDAKGNITALSKGTTTIKATVGGKTLTKKVTVKNNPTVKNGKKAVKNNQTFKVKKNKSLTLTITGKAKKIANKVTTSNKKVAKITSKANKTKVTIKGLKKGTAKIKIKINNAKTYTIEVNVK